MPGNLARLSPKNGSGYVLSATRAATTVEGTAVWCQVLASKPAPEIFAPGAEILQEDSSDQLSRSSMRGCGVEADWAREGVTISRRRARFATGFMEKEHRTSD